MAITEIDTNFDIENYLYLELKNYLATNSKFKPEVYSKSPKNLAKFPTVIFKETGNTDDIQYRSLNRREIVARITDTIEIYTKDMTIGGVRYASKTVLSELKYLIFDFFEMVGATRISADYAEYYDRQIDRYIIVERYLQNNWNKMID